MNRFVQKLTDLSHHNRRRVLSPPAGIDLSSNDYLGMRTHPGLRAAAIAALQNGMDVGAGASRLLRGHTAAHAELESYAAAHFGAERTLFFSCGYQANLAIFQALPARGDWIIFDELIHASARDGIQSSLAQHRKFHHNDLTDLQHILQDVAAKRRAGAMIWIAVESLYSMDGDFAPVSELQALATMYDAMLVVDEAHATGVWGKDGKGLAHDLGRQNNLITLHTCGKAIGVAGGLVCAPGSVIDMLVNTARPFIYSTAPMPLQAYLVQQSLQILASRDGDTRRAALVKLLHNLQSYVPQFTGTVSQIIPIIVGDDGDALALAQALQAQGYDIRAIRPPTVAPGTARLRLSLSSELPPETLHKFMQQLSSFLPELAAA